MGAVLQPVILQKQIRHIRNQEDFCWMLFVIVSCVELSKQMKGDDVSDTKDGR